MDDSEEDISLSNSNELTGPETHNLHDACRVESLPIPSTSSVSNASSRDKSLHVSVQRGKISATTVREGQDELQDLGVEVYDQQTYESGVFEQVNKVLSAADQAAAAKAKESEAHKKGSNKDKDATTTNINDLMRVIHNQREGVGDGKDDSDEEPEDPDARDEQVLQLARAQRLNKQTLIKIERPESPRRSESIQSLPRIPRLSPTIKTEQVYKVEPVELAEDESDEDFNANSNLPIDSNRSTRKKKASRVRESGVLSSGVRFNICDDEDVDSGEASGSEYESSRQEIDEDQDEEDEFSQDIDYETDSEPEQEDGGSSRKAKKRRMDDDGDFRTYQARIKAYNKKRAQLRLDNILPDGTEVKKWNEMTKIDGNLQIPKEMWDNLFEHQKTGVRWLWELHQLGTGGILGDEMGLGKTIQMIAFLTALKCSDIHNAHNNYENLGPTVLVCPATVMHQWLLEFRKWYPQFRVAILHSTGTFSGDRKQLVNVIHKSNGILIVSFPGVVIYQDYLHKLDWHYAILDEGHKIRNPDAQVTLACKRFRTPHRIILSGSPVQNNLKELWSIFDFIYPGKLGTLPVFMGQFGIPITQGGYANATDFQVQIAYKCACVLRDTIKPFLLRRTKQEVNSKLKLPDRSEQVLFCKLTDRQRKMYQHYLESPTVRDIKRGMCQIFVGLIQLRKICNHPDIFDSTDCNDQIKQKEQEHMKKHLEFFSSDETFGHYKKSGKMMVVDALLKLWKKQNHKVLLFTQSRMMIKVFSLYLDELKYRYLTMDGSTPIGVRQSMIEEFNKNDEIFVFLLTTRVGGVGVNLIGANRIIIYDPDWNPSTDIQARERAWRIGQQRHVIIYRLLTAGTIEEKIYHRQVFKLYLTNRVLRDAKQKRFFKTNDMHELFTLADNDKNIETKALFDDDLQINADSIKESKKLKKEERRRKKEKKEERKRQKRLGNSSSAIGNNDGNILSEEKIQALRDKAKKLSRMIVSQYGNGEKTSVNGNGAQELSHVIVDQSENPPSSSVNRSEIHSASSSGENSSKNQGLNSRATSEEGKLSRDRSKSKKRVSFLVKQDIYKPPTRDEALASDEKSDPRYKRDDYILGRLFKNSNISGALKHDRIETDTTADFKVVESEAEKVARDAIRALRESRRMCLGSTSGIPNWTGRNGHVNDSTNSRPRLTPRNKQVAASQHKKNTSSSSGGSDSLLSSIKKRNQLNHVTLARNTFVAGPSNRDSDEEAELDRSFAGKASGTGAEEMADKVREFLLFKSARRGEAQTDELLEFFKSHFKPDMSAVFKALLYKMCDLNRRGDKGFWTIKSEFRDQN